MVKAARAGRVGYTRTVDGGPTLRYEPALDGLRAVAVLAVLGYHLGWVGFDGGHLGVDVFFVLSGFLITRLLVTERDRTGRIGLLRFYGRRARRLLPALLLVLLTLAVFWAVEVPADELGVRRGDGLASLFYVANWRFVLAGQSYFALVADASPLRHVWSLAVEEQFYLMWPLVVIAAIAIGRGSHRVLVAVCAIGAVASAALMFVLWDGADPSRAYYGTDTRAHELLVGALFALVPAGSGLARWFRSRAGHVVGCLAAVGVVVAIVATDVGTGYARGGSLVFAVAVGLVIVTVIGPAPGPLARALSVAPALWVGLRSYGIYLWHWPVVVYVDEARTGLSGAPLLVLRLALIFGIAAASYTFVERPVRDRRVPTMARRVLAPVGIGAAAAAVVIGTAGAARPPAYLRAAPGDVLRLPASTSTTAPPVASSLPVTGADVQPRTAVLFGDSVAYTLAPQLQQALGAAGIAMSATTIPGCGLLDGVTVDAADHQVPWSQGCRDGVPGFISRALAQHDPELVLWLSTWEAQDAIFDGEIARVGTPSGDAALLAGIGRAVDRMTAEGARVLALVPAPPADGDEQAAEPDRVRRIRRFGQLLRHYAATHPDRMTVVALDRMVCPGGPPCPSEVDGVRLRPRDGTHFEPDGARWVSTHLAPVIASFASP